MPIEPFGMAPAEMAAAGCIVFVPNDGGQIEIVNGDPRLVYHATSMRSMHHPDPANPVEQHAVAKRVDVSRADVRRRAVCLCLPGDRRPALNA
jgi:hypothetical protein